MICPECGEDENEVFPWLTGQVADGLHRIHEIKVSIVTGCASCSETLRVVPIEEYIREKEGR